MLSTHFALSPPFVVDAVSATQTGWGPSRTSLRYAQENSDSHERQPP
jgi:hypothetical protein